MPATAVDGEIFVEYYQAVGEYKILVSSRKLCKKLLDTIENKNKELHSHIVKFNLAHAFYTDICGIGILFDGKVTGSRILYTDYYYEYEPLNIIHRSTYNIPEDCVLFDEIVDAISEGNELVFQKKELVIKSKDKPDRTLKKPDHLFWKIVSFY